ncbi:MAG TPA: class I SAM-dependent methyltransferase [Terriglobales bacterium]|nr:class I SAM-dependent methyltransferase [Terriglobales bacterium]
MPDGTDSCGGMSPEALAVARSCKGFLDESEGLRLFELAREQASLGPILEIGSYCGKSAVYLGSGARAAGGTLVCVDHHRGSEEHQVGEEYHDAELFDVSIGRLDSLPQLRRTLHRAGLEEHTVLLVAASRRAAAIWSRPLGMVFIDGGHSDAAAHGDYESWSPHLAAGGILAIHDLFPDLSQGGQAPIEVYRRALATGAYEELANTKTLGVLRRLV